MIYVIDSDNEKVKKALDDNGIGFETYETPIDLFCIQEAKYRIEQFEDDYKEKFTKEASDELECVISNIYLDENESFIDSDYLYNVACNEIDQFISENETRGLKIFMTREE